MSKIFLIYDVPKTKNALMVRIWREFRKMDAEKIMDSVWTMEDNEINLEILKRIKDLINQNGGTAKLLRVVEIE